MVVDEWLRKTAGYHPVIESPLFVFSLSAIGLSSSSDLWHLVGP